MSVRLLTLVLLGSALLVAGTAAEAQTADAVTADRIYTEGDRAESPWTGVSFVVPTGSSAQYDADLAAVVLHSSNVRTAVFAASEATPDELGEVILTLLGDQGIRLAEESVVRQDEQTIRGTYTAVTAEGIGLMRAAARGGPHGNAVAVAALGARDQEDAIDAAVTDILDSVVWSEPEARSWSGRIEGRRFTLSDHSSDYSPGGAGGYGSHASGKNAALDLCSDRSYAFESRKESYISIEGASAERVESDAHTGRWRVVADIGGTAYLILEAADGRSFTWMVEEAPQGLLIDGTRYSPAPDRRCP